VFLRGVPLQRLAAEANLSQNNPLRREDRSFLEIVTRRREVAGRSPRKASLVPGRVEELVKKGRVVTIVSTHSVPSCPGHIDGHDVGPGVVAALLSPRRPSAELSRRATEARTETACLTQRVERHRLRLARLDDCWSRFRQVGMPGHGAGVPVNGAAPRQERLSGPYTSMWPNRPA
jgi:hypothetical protein